MAARGAAAARGGAAAAGAAAAAASPRAAGAAAAAAPGGSTFARWLRADGQAGAAGGAAARARAAASLEQVAADAAKGAGGPMTLSTWLLRMEQQGKVDGELAIVLSSIATACKQIGSLVNRASLVGATGLAGEQNVQGEDQKKLDVISNDIFNDCLRNSGRTGYLASEEEDVPIAVEETYGGNYVVCFDPLDGSSNIDAGISVGSIFGVFEPSEQCLVEDRHVVTDSVEGDLTDEAKETLLYCCQPGRDLLSAGYVMYSSSTVLVLSVGDGVVGFTLDNLIGDFVMTHADIKIPETGKIYSFNEGNAANWSEGLKNYMSHVKAPEGEGSSPYSARYIGSLVGDFHRTMLYGGIYGYPGDKKNVNGKLRLIYECAPMSFLAEQAGGAGSTGDGRVLDLQPEAVHQRCPLFIGSKKEVEKLEEYFKQG